MTSTTRALHLLALSAFAIAQPLLDLLGRNAQFFVAHSAGAFEIFALLTVLLVLPPLLLMGVEFLAAMAHRRAGDVLHTAFVGGLLFLIVLPPLARSVGGAAVPAGAMALVTAGCGVWCYRSLPALKGMLSLMAAGPVVFAGLFLANEDIRRLVFAESKTSGFSASAENPAPIVMIVFDELPLSSLLDRKGGIDGVRYPGFAELAQHSTWFPRAASVSDRTSSALPAIVTGNRPSEKSRLPIRSNYPDNLFSWLDDAYILHAVEPRTLFHMADTGAPDEPEAPLGVLAVDTAIVTLHLLLPKSMRDSLPQISRTWGNFAGNADSATEKSAQVRESEDKLRHKRSRRLLSIGEAQLFRNFIRRIEEQHAESRSDRPPMHFLHTDLPHGPWHLLPSGVGYAPTKDYGLRALRWTRDPWWGLDAYRRHLMQLAVADELLTELLAALRRAEIFEDCLLIIVADHGACFWPKHLLRSMIRNPHPEDLIHIPLFIKRPGQDHALVDRRVASILDIMPTIADVIGARAVWPMDGCSLLSTTCGARPRLSVFASQESSNMRLEIPSAVLSRTATLHRKLAAFGDGARGDGLYNVAPYAKEAGRSVAEFEISERAVGKLVLEKRVRERMAADDARVPARFSGLIEFDTRPGSETPRVAIVVDEKIATIVPAPHDGKHGLRVSAMLPPSVLGSPAEMLRTYVLDDARLHRLVIE
jgi:hypothetical protein